MTRFLALGDSYTIGEAVPPDDAWPNLIATRLGVAGPQIIAKTGWTTDELDAAIDDARPEPPFDLVTLLIGVNDQYRGRSAEEYRPKFTALLRRAIGFAGDEPRRVVVVSIPDWGVTPFAAGRDGRGIAVEIDAFNRMNRDESRKAETRYVDVTHASRELASDPSMHAFDGLHPSAAMYRRWADLIISEARDALAIR
ncbi:MAG TPA: SGNH/GDSL hydrolase family protein [Thermoanaerobaculia bacterium]|nr:SGNH/GDSL hydrolase family protein [Thermoanaerobaculia bacterium]